MNETRNRLEETINYAFTGGGVKRFHTCTTIKEQSVAEHTFGVLLFLTLLVDRISPALLAEALAHDLPEQRYGDIPAPTKRTMDEISRARLEAVEEELNWSYGLGCIPETAPVSYTERRWLKMADILDGLMFCVRERALGNKSIDLVWIRYNQYITDLKPKGKELDVIEAVRGLWIKAKQGHTITTTHGGLEYVKENL